MSKQHKPLFDKDNKLQKSIIIDRNMLMSVFVSVYWGIPGRQVKDLASLTMTMVPSIRKTTDTGPRMMHSQEEGGSQSPWNNFMLGEIEYNGGQYTHTYVYNVNFFIELSSHHFGDRKLLVACTDMREVKGVRVSSKTRSGIPQDIFPPNLWMYKPTAPTRRNVILAVDEMGAKAGVMKEKGVAYFYEYDAREHNT